MTQSDNDLEALREQTETTDRISQEQPTDHDAATLTDVVAALDAISEGEVGKTFAVRDASISALLLGLEANDELDDIAADLADALDRDAPTGVDRSEVIRLLVRVGLREAAPEYWELLEDAKVMQAKESL